MASRSPAAWAPPADRADPVAILAAQGRDRIAELLPLRYERMRADRFAFLRGAAAVMAADLATQPNSGVNAQLCGDAHVQNFGSYTTPEGLAVFDVNDFDETLAGPFEWDVKRLATSLAVSGAVQDLGPRDCRALAARAARHYRRHVAGLSGLSPLEIWHSRIDLDRAIAATDGKLQRRLRRRRREIDTAHAAHYHLIEPGPTPRLRDHAFTQHIDAYAPTMRDAFAAYPESQPAHVQSLLARYRLVDVAFKMVGVGSVGTFCALGLFVSPRGAPLLLQLKEAQESVLARFLPTAPWVNQGERAVTGQRMMQALPDLFLGFAAHPVEGRSFYVRSLKDSRMAGVGAIIEAEALPFSAGLCGRTLARAHARSGDAGAIAAWIGEGREFDEAIADFAMAYTAQTTADWLQFRMALDGGKLRADAA